MQVLERSGVQQHQLHFVRERSGKATLCIKMGVTHFVDDRLSNLSLMTSVSRRYLFLPTKPDEVPSWVTWVPSWEKLEPQLLSPAEP